MKTEENKTYLQSTDPCSILGEIGKRFGETLKKLAHDFEDLAFS